MSRPGRRRRGRGSRYSAWDGTQRGFELDAGAVLEEMNDDLLYHGDVHAALRRLLQNGMTNAEGERMAGLREALRRLRERRQQLLERYDLGGVHDEIARELREIVGQERAAEDPAGRDALDTLPPDLPGRVRALQAHDWADPEAQRRFEELVDRLRSQILDSTFRRLAGGLATPDPEQLARVKDMLAELNGMLEQRARGEEPDFAGFMGRYGDLVPGNPRDLDEFLEQMAASMARMRQLLNSMSPEQRAELAALAASLLEDVDLNWQVDQLARHLQDAFPDLGWEQSLGGMPGARFPGGGDPLSMGQVPGLLDALGDLDDLEHLLGEATAPGALAEVDVERARELLGDDIARSLEQLAELARTLEEAGLIEQREGRLELTPRGMRAVGQRALGDLFRRLERDRIGAHAEERAGIGHDPAYEHRPYEWGDPFRLDVSATMRNALARSGPGTPLHIQPDDFEVDRTEAMTRVATVLLLDVSLSMAMRDSFLAAKKVAMAMHALVTSQFPRDSFGLVSFGRVAREIPPERLPELSWDFEWGTNMAHALALARRMLAHQLGTKQVIMVTDGEPTAHVTDGEVSFQYPPSPVTIEETLKEVVRCTRAGIRINTFMLDASPGLGRFVERLTRLNRGRAFFTTPETLGDYVLVDFLEQRRQRRGGGHRAAG